MSETYQEARKNVVRMAQHYIDYCASYGTKCSFYEYCEPDIPMTTETKELIAKVSDSLHGESNLQRRQMSVASNATDKRSQVR